MFCTLLVLLLLPTFEVGSKVEIWYMIMLLEVNITEKNIPAAFVIYRRCAARECHKNFEPNLRKAFKIPPCPPLAHVQFYASAP